MKKFFGEFKKFITRGNIIDMSVGVIVGGAFTAIVNGLTNNSNVTIKRVKNDRGLIEKTESDKNKIILVEDNRQIICG